MCSCSCHTQAFWELLEDFAALELMHRRNRQSLTYPHPFLCLSQDGRRLRTHRPGGRLLLEREDLLLNAEGVLVDPEAPPWEQELELAEVETE